MFFTIKNKKQISDSRVEHVRERHEGQVHQADPEEGVQVREQVCKAARESRKIRIRKSAEIKIIIFRLRFLSMCRLT